MNSFAVALLLVLSVAACGAITTVEDLQRALNTPERIWTVQRSYEVTGKNGKHSCVYAYKTYLGVNYYTFEQRYKDGNTWVKEDLIGELSPSHRGAVLTVKKHEGNEGRAYTLLYWDEGRRCGILHFHDKQDGKDKCELHVRESALQTSGGHYPCWEEYQKQCPGYHNYPVYQPSCMV